MYLKLEVDDNLERELEQLKTSQGLLGQTSQQMGEQVSPVNRLGNRLGTWSNKRKLKDLKGSFLGTIPSVRHTFCSKKVKRQNEVTFSF